MKTKSNHHTFFSKHHTLKNHMAAAGTCYHGADRPDIFRLGHITYTTKSQLVACLVNLTCASLLLESLVGEIGGGAGRKRRGSGEEKRRGGELTFSKLRTAMATPEDEQVGRRGVRRVLLSSPASPAAAAMVEGERASSQADKGRRRGGGEWGIFTVYVLRLGFSLIHRIERYPNQV